MFALQDQSIFNYFERLAFHVMLRVMAGGGLIVGLSTLAYQNSIISASTWIALSGECFECPSI